MSQLPPERRPRQTHTSSTPWSSGSPEATTCSATCQPLSIKVFHRPRRPWSQLVPQVADLAQTPTAVVRAARAGSEANGTHTALKQTAQRAPRGVQLEQCQRFLECAQTRVASSSGPHRPRSSKGRSAASVGTFLSQNGSRNAPRKCNTCDRWLLSRSLRRSSGHQLPRGQLLVCMTPLRSWKGGCSGNTASLREALESGDSSTVFELSSVLADCAERLHTLSRRAGVHMMPPWAARYGLRSVREGEATHVVLLVTFQGSWTTPAHSASVTHVTSEGGSPIASHVSSDAPQPTARRTRSPRGVNMSDWDECRGQSRRTASPYRANSSPHRSANKKLFRRRLTLCLHVRISPRPQILTLKVSNFVSGDDVSSMVWRHFLVVFVCINIFTFFTGCFVQKAGYFRANMSVS